LRLLLLAAEPKLWCLLIWVLAIVFVRFLDARVGT